MTRLEALKKLAAKVEAGDNTYFPGKDFHIAMGGREYEFMGGTKGALEVDSSYSGSLDAAKALHEAVLPGWWWKVGTCRGSDDACVSPEGPESVMPDGTEWSDYTDVDMRPPGNPARAWLLAILRALIAQEAAE